MSRSVLAITYLMFLAALTGVSTELRVSADGDDLPLHQKTPSIKKQDLQKVEACDKEALNKLALDLPLIAYPPDAARKNVGGKVIVKVFVDESGSVYHAIPTDGPSLLRKAALGSARRAKFAPFRKDDKPMRCSGNLIYTFNPPNPKDD